jgi:uncharacterized membrane protein YkoI
MKKTASIILALSILISAFAPCAFAESDMEEIVANVKSRVGITDEYTDFSSSYYTSNNLTTYQLNWTLDEKSIEVTYNSDDVITSYGSYTTYGRGNKTSIPKISVEEAKKSAQDFIDKLNPSFKGEFIVSDIDNTTQALNGDYFFNIERFKNNIRIYGNLGYISIDRNTGEALYMYITYTHIDEFADISNVISLEDAKEIYKDKLGLELVYKTYSEDKKIIIFPAYVKKDSRACINAVNGEVYSPPSRNYSSASETAASSSSTYDSGLGNTELSKIEINELDKISGLISKEDIEAQIRNNKILHISGTLQSIRLNRNYYDNTKYIYQLSFKNDESYIYVSVDAQTGEIIYYNFDDNPNSEALDVANVKEYTDTIFNELAGDKKSEFQFEAVNDNTAVYRRFVNGAKVQNEKIYIIVDKNGNLLYYKTDYSTNIDFPPITDAISADEAADKMFEAVPYELCYYADDSVDNKVTANAVYILSDDISVNPFTGKLVDYQNNEIKDNAKTYSYSDIENHYAKNQIETLGKFGIGFEGDKFFPNEKITQRDFLYMLLAISDNHISQKSDDDLYNMAKYSNYITDEERDDNGEVTREYAAKLIIRFKGAENFAKYNDIYVSPFNDVTENKGYIALLSAMNIIKGDGSGNFYPKNSLTRAEAACLVYNYLNME